MNLTPSEYSILQTIATFGHYVTRKHIELVRPDITSRWANKMLENLTEKGYLKVETFFGGYDTFVYKTTYKTRKLFGTPSAGSSNVVTIKKHLVMLHFLYQKVGFDNHEPVSTEMKRQNYLRKLGVEIFSNREPMIALTEPFVLCEPYNKDGGICISIPDHDHFEAFARPYKPLLQMVEKYKPLRDYIPISFVVPVETSVRGRTIEAAYASPRWFRNAPPLSVHVIDFSYNLFTLSENLERRLWI